MYGPYNILRFYVDMCYSQVIDNTILQHRVHANTHTHTQTVTRTHRTAQNNGSKSKVKSTNETDIYKMLIGLKPNVNNKYRIK